MYQAKILRINFNFEAVAKLIIYLLLFLLIFMLFTSHTIRNNFQNKVLITQGFIKQVVHEINDYTITMRTSDGLLHKIIANSETEIQGLSWDIYALTRLNAEDLIKVDYFKVKGANIARRILIQTRSNKADLRH
ncbi:MAG: hypothetical protein A2Y40_00265 [Candidatus Margulisbacteria bacterium GWF2_35_9]|nr:MAG: hypothetical protein A2Y40_00265 [Candidatus Margulisbacteria bacterium GWF2_35_9]